MFIETILHLSEIRNPKSMRVQILSINIYQIFVKIGLVSYEMSWYTKPLFILRERSLLKMTLIFLYIYLLICVSFRNGTSLIIKLNAVPGLRPVYQREIS